MIQLAICSYIVLTQSPTVTRVPQPATPTLAEVAAKASQLTKQLDAPVSGTPQVRWLAHGVFYASWPSLTMQFYGTAEPKSYLDYTLRHLDSDTWYADEQFVKRNPWMQQAVKKAVPQSQVLAELKPDSRNVRNRRSQPLSGSLIEGRWSVQSANGIPFHIVNPPQVIIDFDSKTHKIATINWRLNYKAIPPGKAFNKQRAIQKLASLFTNYFKRNGKPAYSPGKLDVQLMYVADNGSRLNADGTGTWGKTPNPDVRTYQVAYVGTYGHEQVWLDAATLNCIGGFFGPE